MFRVVPQYKYRPPNNKKCCNKDQTVVRPSYLCNGNSHTLVRRHSEIGKPPGRATADDYNENPYPSGDELNLEYSGKATTGTPFTNMV